MIFEQHLEFEERLDAVFGRSAAPFREGGGFDSLIHFVRVGERDLGQDFAGGGVDHIAEVGGLRVGPAAVDVVGQSGVGGGDGGHFAMPRSSPRMVRGA